jgi:cytochrome oxidase Cu insertion factor (SCO1/SenC/PrrC family)
MGRTTFLGVLALVVGLAVAGALISEYRRDHLDGGTLRLPRRAPDFALKTPDGAEFRLSQQRGKVVLVDGRVHAAVR